MAWVLVLLLSGAADPLAEATRSFEAGRFDEALRKLDALVLSTTGEAAAPVQLMRARCLSAMGREPEVDSALALALAADPEVSFGSSRVPPPLVNRLTSLKLLNKGYLTVQARGLVDSDVLKSMGRHTRPVMR